jgi:hypothetical protein
MDQWERADKIEPTLAAEPIENAEASEPTDPTTGSSPRSRSTGSSQMSRSTGLIRSTRRSGWSLRTRVNAMSRLGSPSQHSGRQETSQASRAECCHLATLRPEIAHSAACEDGAMAIQLNLAASGLHSVNLRQQVCKIDDPHVICGLQRIPRS